MQNTHQLRTVAVAVARTTDVKHVLTFFILVVFFTFLTFFIFPPFLKTKHAT